LSKIEVNKNLRKANIELYDDIDNQQNEDYYEKVYYETSDEKDLNVKYEEIIE
jgi:hypothetical protein